MLVRGGGEGRHSKQTQIKVNNKDRTSTPNRRHIDTTSMVIQKHIYTIGYMLCSETTINGHNRNYQSSNLHGYSPCRTTTALRQSYCPLLFISMFNVISSVACQMHCTLLIIRKSCKLVWYYFDVPHGHMCCCQATIVDYTVKLLVPKPYCLNIVFHLNKRTWFDTSIPKNHTAGWNHSLTMNAS